ncbi:hypothetical protein [Klebsiella sp. BIGb0407]|uniref:hypothetical protein n=1 Tax=Klebsiella sp. BIGb0407 TaxID=2940603 RepID=UPI00216A32D1|nr:hypothetical protein [Klebsiella sp. BIGb0407]MCS3433964.1 hypothetical protein [Klebsiella sp. BIGb0407]
MTKIDIIGGAVMGGWYDQQPDYKAGTVTPSDAGISLRNCLLPEDSTDKTMLSKKPRYNGNCVEVYGTPTRPGVIKIKIAGGMYGHMFAPCSYFSKDYTLTVIEP